MASFKQVLHPAIAPIRLGTPVFTIGSCIWSAITSIDSVRIISIRPEPRDTNVSLLQSYFLRDRINFCLQQHKMQVESNNVVPPT